MENEYLKDHYYLRSYTGPPPPKVASPKKRKRSKDLVSDPPVKLQKLGEDFNSPEWLAFRECLLAADITTGLNETISEEEI